MGDFKYKYQTQLDTLSEVGYEMPQVYLPNKKPAARFVFANLQDKNHIPVCVSNPKRILPGPTKTSGYALSCFGNSDKAKERYIALQANFKQINQTIGDSLAQGILENEDGRITKEDQITHFDLYESSTCDLNKTFTTITKL